MSGRKGGRDETRDPGTNQGRYGELTPHRVCEDTKSVGKTPTHQGLGVVVVLWDVEELEGNRHPEVVETQEPGPTE